MRVGIIGCGAVAVTHLQALGALPVEVVGLADPDDGRAARVAARFGVPQTYREAVELLERGRPDVVHVLTPPQSHRDISILALESGCHVLVEKPMAVDIQEADEIVEAARRSGKAVGVGHSHLFNPPVLEARALKRDGALGTVVGVEAGFTMHGKMRDRCFETEWIRDLPGGPMHELAPHPLYLLREFLGDLSLASAVRKSLPEQDPPRLELRALFESESGLGMAAVSFSGRPLQSGMRIYGTKATVHVDLRGQIAVLARRDLGSGSRLRRARSKLELGAQLIGQTAAAAIGELRRPSHRGHPVLIATFYEALRAGRPPPVTAEDGRAVVALLDGLWEALSPVEAA
jgi:predicted dehydrogenase